MPLYKIRQISGGSMTDKKITTSTNENLYINIRNGSLEKPQKHNNYRATVIWDALASYNTNNDQVLDSKEISVFTKEIQEYAGDDKHLDEGEMQRLANKMGVSIDKLKNFIYYIF